MFAQSSLKSHIALRALLPSFSNRSRTDSWSFGIVEDPLLHHEMQQSMTLRPPPATTLHGRPHGGGRTWRSSSVLSQSSAATLPDVILAIRYGMTRCCAQNERVVFTNKLSITSLLMPVRMPNAQGLFCTTIPAAHCSCPCACMLNAQGLTRDHDCMYIHIFINSYKFTSIPTAHAPHPIPHQSFMRAPNS
jgi:hypothetical protein